MGDFFSCKKCGLNLLMKEGQNINRVLGGHKKFCLNATAVQAIRKHSIRTENIDYNEYVGEEETFDDEFDYQGEYEPDEIETRYIARNSTTFSSVDYEVDIRFYLFQCGIYDKYFSDKAPFRPGFLKGFSNRPDWEDYVLVNEFIKKNHLSSEAGNELCSLIRITGQRHGTELHFHTRLGQYLKKSTSPQEELTNLSHWGSNIRPFCCRTTVQTN
jgi:hypothetical protein